MRNKFVKKTFLLLFLFVFTFGALQFLHPAKDRVKAASEESNQRIFDLAGLLSTSEYEELEEMCIDYGEKAGIDIFILTHDNPDTVEPERYIEDFEDQLPVGDRVYFLYDRYRSKVFIEGYGAAENYIHSKRIDVILDHMVPDLKAGNYYDAFATYIELSSSYMQDDSELNYDSDYSYSSNPNEENIVANIWFQLGVSLLIGAVAVGIMAYNSGGRMTAGSNTYIDSGHSGLIGRRDNYIRTTVTRVRKPTQNNSSGGGFNAGGFRGGISSGGRSHSSGGRSI